MLGKLRRPRWFTSLSLWYRYSVAWRRGGAPVHFAVHCRWRTISRAAIKPKFRGLRSVTPPINRNRNSPLPFNSRERKSERKREREKKEMNRMRSRVSSVRAILVGGGTTFLHKTEGTLPCVSVTLSEIAERRWLVKLIAPRPNVGQGERT